MRRVTIDEATADLDGLIAEVEAGADVVIVRDNVPVARLVSVARRRLGGVRVPVEGIDEPLPEGELAAWEGRQGPSVVAVVVDVLGVDAVAGASGVDAATVAAWAAGEAAPPPDATGVLADLDALVDDLRQAFTPAQAQAWLDGPNAYLGATPRNVIATRDGITAVRRALAAHQQGAPD